MRYLVASAKDVWYVWDTEKGIYVGEPYDTKPQAVWVAYHLNLGGGSIPPYQLEGR